ncbi:alpha/beta fold hydrolase [Pedobacter jeongneungensis]|uniref:alpha/beta fold hydrolase n=1 Tax=Pedobacter jeongneungensis TaxID=947309 RepID=UPI000A5F5AD6|nr:alpha/beta fold hydrolase [Pedobacter jeongneungensis]
MVSQTGKQARTSKPVLVFLHYFGGSKASWQWVITALEPEFICLAINLPGFGGSPGLSLPSIENFSDYILQEIKASGCTNCTLIGHSMGGKLALQCAATDEGDLIESLILVTPSPPSVERMSKSKEEKMKEDPDEIAAKKSVEEAICLKLGKAEMDTAIASPQQVESATRKWWIEQGIHHSIADSAKALSLPIHVLLAAGDPAITMEMSDQYTLPNLPINTPCIVHPTSGHLIPLEDPQWLSEQIRKICTLDLS